MERFLDIFFFIDALPSWMLEAGRVWGIDMACLCALPNFFNLILHFIIGGILITVLMQRRMGNELFFSLLLLGIVFSGVSKFIDWVQNMLTATGDSVFFSYNLDIAIELLQFVGMAIIVYSVFKMLFQPRSHQPSLP